MSKSNTQCATPKSRLLNAKSQAQNLKAITILPVFTQSPKPNASPKSAVFNWNLKAWIQSPEPKAQSPKPSTQSPQSRAQIPESKIQNPKCKIESPEPKVQSSQSQAQTPKTRIPKSESQSAKWKIQSHDSRLQNPKSQLQNTNSKAQQSPRPLGFCETLTLIPKTKVQNPKCKA